MFGCGCGLGYGGYLCVVGCRSGGGCGLIDSCGSCVSCDVLHIYPPDLLVVTEGLSLCFVPLVKPTILQLHFVCTQGTVWIKFVLNLAPYKQVKRQFFQLY